MDDQFKRPDDLFGFRYGEEQADGKREAEEKEARGEAEETVYRTAGSESDRPAPATYTYGPYSIGSGAASGAASGGQDGGTGQQPTVVTAPREYRPFTVSGGGRGWEQPPRRRSSFRAMFASFLAGVVVVGGLMYAADKGNWFTDRALADAAATPQASTAKPASGSVSTAADVVRPNTISAIFDAANPAVVKIETFAKSSSRQQSSLFDDPFFRQFFGDDFGGDNGGNGGNSETETGLGSGFIFDSNGYILTNDHVIEDADRIQVTVVGHSEPYTATLLGHDYDLDLAVLKIDGTGFPSLKLGDSDAANIGDWVIAIGNPYGFDHTLTVGVLSAKERPIPVSDGNQTRNYEHLLQTDASINPGNSGGPLLNLNGEVIGINTAVSSEAQGIGFAIPTSTIETVLDDLKNNKEIPKKPTPFIGATLATLTPDIAKRLGIDTDTKGSIVTDVLYGTPAYKGDLRQYDVILGMDGTNYSTNEDLIAAIQKKNVGDTVTLNVLRGDKKIDLKVEIGNKNDYDQQQQQ